MIRKQYTPRPYADLAMAHMRNVGRGALFAKPGMGKTTLGLTHLDIRHNVWGESAPSLVLGPKRVAKDVWTDEVGKWQHLSSLEVVSMVGDPEQRLRALRRDAPVKVINYDNLPWLVEHAKPWPFRLVIADESTRLKNFRVKQGGTRAHALATVAHLVDEWVLLTGTPAPNGLKDLWGQMWFLDRGDRLGKTFSAFEERWFGWRRVKDALSHSAALQPVIFPFASEQIHALLADICLTLDPKDWFDIKDPVINVIECTLPARAKAQYRELERDLFVQLQSGEAVEVFNEASLSGKCLQFASGAVYLEGGVDWRPVHDEKLDALESLVEEQAGAPLLVAYHFKPDLARMKARFPDALDLSTDEGMRAAKAGLGAVWFGHPASMGHGVDGLQEHCCDVAFFGHWWDLEHHDQIIERVGPMRQLQAGKDRAVTVHYIVTKGTIDQVVMARRFSKREVQDLLLDYMKAKA